MTIRIARLALLAGTLAALMGQPALAADKWDLLGATSYNVRPVKDVINVGPQPGGFKAIRIEVRQSDVEVLDLKVIYGNGAPDDISVRQSFKAGSTSRVIDLKGGSRQIKQIMVTYLPKGPAKILFFGVAGAVVPIWEQLGCKSVGFGIDHDVIPVGRREGQFTALKLRVKDAPIEIFNLSAVFGNGARQDIKVKSVIPSGAETRVLDLAGNARGLDRIEILYRSIPTFKGKAALCVDGRQAR